MIALHTLFKEISYQEIVASLVKTMAETLEDFPPDLRRFEESLAALGSGVRDASVPSVEELREAIHRQIGCRVVFSCWLGFKASLDHFTDPVSRSFLEVDPEVFLQENTASQLPDFQSGQLVQRRFYAALTPAQQELYRDVIAYICHLETVGPKLAHYCGYLLGNRFFSRVVPGFCEDLRLTRQYRQMLEDYLGVGLGADILTKTL